MKDSEEYTDEEARRIGEWQYALERDEAYRTEVPDGDLFDDTPVMEEICSDLEDDEEVDDEE